MRLRRWLYYKVIWPLFLRGFQWAHGVRLVEVRPGGAAPPLPFPGGG